MNIKKIILFVFAFFCMQISFAQQQNPASWNFKVTNVTNDEATLQFTVNLQSGWHIYSQHTDKNGPIGISFNFKKDPKFECIGKVTEPKPHVEYDELFKCNILSFQDKVTFKQRIKVKSEKDFTVSGTMSYQLCNEGSCIPPEDVDFSFKVKGVKNADTSAVEDTTTIEDTISSENVASADTTSAITTEENANTEDNEGEQSLLVIFLLALGGGILTMFTPCVFPMIPMTVNFFMNNGDDKKKSRRQAWIFGFSIVFIFAILGAILSLVFGPEALYFIGTHWIPNLLFFIIFMTFALSFFGLFEIKMPERWVNKSDQQADKGGWLAPFFIALTTVLVSFSCTGPILGAALIGLTTAGSTARIISLLTMLGFGIGFALPFTLLAMFPGFLKNLKSGGWLNTVKVAFAFLELAFGLKFLSMADLYCGWRLLDREVYLALWIVIFAMLGFYLIGKLKFKGDEDVKQIGVVRLFLAVLDFAFVVYMIPGLFGAPLKAISGFIPPMETQDFNIEELVYNSNKNNTLDLSKDQLPARKYSDKLHLPTGFDGFFDLDEAKAYAKEVGKPIFVDFTGKTCANCREMEHYVWADKEVSNLLQNKFVMCALYADENTIELPENEWVTDENGKVLKTLGRKNLNYQKTQFNMNAQPYYVIINSDGAVLTKENYKYNRDVQKFLNFLNEGLNNFGK